MRRVISLIYLLAITGSIFAQSTEGILTHYKEISKSFELPEVLEEVSGLAVTGDGRVFCHNDVEGKIYQVDPEYDYLVKDFYIGSVPVQRLFKGIAVTEDKFYLVSSSAVIFEFNEADDKYSVDYVSYDLDLGRKVDVEGLAYDKNTNSLILACKNYPGRGYKGNRAFYTFDLNTKTLVEKPRFLLDLDVLEDEFGMEDFYPTGIEFCPFNESIFILSGEGDFGIVEIDYNGKILNTMTFKNEHHIQPSGIGFLADKSLIISDAADGEKPMITIYKYGE